MRARHRRRLRAVGWEQALDATGRGYSESTAPPRAGNDLEVLIDGSAALPAMAEELQRAESHVHLAGWFLSPQLQLTRGDDPVVVRNLLAELAERVDVRVLIWGGAPVRLFRPSRSDVRRMVDELCHETKVKCEIDSCVGPLHCHHEKTIVIDDRVAFVGGIDLTLDARRPFRLPRARRTRQRRLARRGRAPARACGGRRRGALPHALGGRDGRAAAVARAGRRAGRRRGAGREDGP